MMRPLQLVRVAPTEPLWIVSAVETRERERAFLCPRKRAAPLSLWGKLLELGEELVTVHTPSISSVRPLATLFENPAPPDTVSNEAEYGLCLFQ